MNSLRSLASFHSNENVKYRFTALTWILGEKTIDIRNVVADARYLKPYKSCGLKADLRWVSQGAETIVSTTSDHLLPMRLDRLLCL